MMSEDIRGHKRNKREGRRKEQVAGSRSPLIGPTHVGRSTYMLHSTYALKRTSYGLALLHDHCYSMEL
jgi:hypothetical protein